MGGYPQDLLFPLKEGNNREERILVEYDGFIKCLSEAVIYNLLLNKSKYINKYPLLKLYEQFNSYELYDNCFLYTPEYLLYYLSECNIEKETLAEDLFTLLRTSVLGYQEDVLFEYGLHNLLQQDYVSSVHIVNRYLYNEYDINRFKFIFPSTTNKIKIMESDDIFTLINQNDYTTIFMNDVTELLQMPSKIKAPKNLQSILFILRNVDDNIRYEGTEIKYNYESELQELRNKYQMVIGRMFSMRLKKPGKQSRKNVLNLNEGTEII